METFESALDCAEKGDVMEPAAELRRFAISYSRSRFRSPVFRRYFNSAADYLISKTGFFANSSTDTANFAFGE